MNQFRAASEGDEALLRTFITQDNINDTRHVAGAHMTVLQLAVFNSHEACVKYLLEMGANIYVPIPRFHGWKTIAHMAGANGNVNILRMIQKCCNVHFVMDTWMFPFYYLIVGYDPKQKIPHGSYPILKNVKHTAKQRSS